MIKLFLLIFALSFHLCAHANEIYVVKNQDCLSEIAYKFCRKVYGKTGFVQKIKELNPEKIKNTNFVLKNTTLMIPEPFLCPLPWPVTQPIELAKAEPEIQTQTQVQAQVELTPDPEILPHETDKYFFGAYTFYKTLSSGTISDSSLLGVSRINGVHLGSKPLLGLNVGYVYPFSEKTIHILTYDFHTEDYYGSKNVTINSESIYRSALDYSLQRQLTNSNNFRLGAGVEERTMIDKSSYQQINLNKVLTPYLKSVYSHLIQENHFMKTHLTGSARYLAPGRGVSLRSDGAFEFGLGIHYSSQLKKRKTVVGLDFKQLDQSTNVTHQTEQRIGLSWVIDLNTY